MRKFNNTTSNNLLVVFLKSGGYRTRTESLRLSADVLFELVYKKYPRIRITDVKEWLMDNGYRTSNASKFCYKYSADSIESTSVARFYTFDIRNFMSGQYLEDFRREAYLTADNMAAEK